ncbi:L-2-hydroxyglutarate oxidase [Pararobbsia silviterrae]|uniref:L-2-hydroxyglutarate oxidase n=1 Tax=Pararobbsia silviterrae TaxID=1792498 RepID=A0A494XV34_9BURK|nr:L-2-hydroxyglutarate oxidase [Pararobbsia silviterrae]RKP53573.1 L-2-hydroxyglutarate oxidase [Pararobbsia silviterrae]
MKYDVCVIGGGIVGLATALAVQARRPHASVLVLEKEPRLAAHQTGHNSGVIHSGIYYKPGSLKARLCLEGASAVKRFCDENGVPYDTCGKLIVATNARESSRMDDLLERARINGVHADRLTKAELAAEEPAVDGEGAILVHDTAIVDYKRVCTAIGEKLQRNGATIEMGVSVTGIREKGTHVEVDTPGAAFTADKLIACAGLQSDRIARLAGLEIEHRIIPFRGEYFKLPASKNDIVKRLVYPVPDPALPFLGIHVTKTMGGGQTVGPNAVLGTAREGYAKHAVNLRDLFDLSVFPGFWRLLVRYRASAFHELVNSLWKRGYLDECRKYCPSLSLDDLLPMGAGIRAQAVRRDGSMIDDFLFLQTPRMLHVCNAPSPAATSSLPIGRMIAEQCLG